MTAKTEAIPVVSATSQEGMKLLNNEEPENRPCKMVANMPTLSA